MEINKIQFGQLSQSKGIEKSFEDLDVNNDGVINEEDKTLVGENQALAAEITNLLNSVDEETELADTADFDESETPTANNTVAGQNPTSSSQATLALMQFEISKLNDKQSEIQKDIEDKQKELETKQKKIEDKQEELEILVKEAQNNKDNSMLAQIADLQSEIKSLLSEVENLTSSIEKLESDYRTNSQTLTSLSANFETHQTTVTQDVSQVNALASVNGITAPNAVGETTATDTTTSTNFERKTLAEYAEQIDSKFDNLWAQFNGDADAVLQYVKNNLNEFTDIDGDGVVNSVDLLIFQNWRLTHHGGKYNALVQEKGLDYAKALAGQTASSFGYSLYFTIQRCSKSSMMDLDDLEYFYQNGGARAAGINPAWGHYSDDNGFTCSSLCQIDYTKIAQSENWEERLNAVFANVPQATYSPNSKLKENTIKYVQKLADFIKANPKNANYAQVAVKYQEQVEAYNARKEKAETIDWEQRAQEKNDSADATYEKRYKTSRADYNNYVKNKCNGKKEYAVSYEEYCREGLAHTSAAELKAEYIGKEPAKDKFNTNFDINGDGVINADDLACFSTEVDLDGDGCVSDAEKSYLGNTKKELDKKVYNYVKTNGIYNQNTIEDVISYYVNVDVAGKYDDINNFIESRSEEKKAFYDRYNAIWDTNINWEEKPFLGIHLGIPLTSRFVGTYSHILANFGYMDGTCGDKDFIEKIIGGNVHDVTEAWNYAMEMSEPSNTFLHYVQSANLSKEELQTILDKINAAPSSIQSQLAEVKKVVESKLAAME